MKLPRMYRKKRGDHYVGSWRAMIAGKEVNFGTSNAEEARVRLLEAVKRGRRNFDDELADAAELEGAPEEGFGTQAAAGTADGTGFPVGTPTNPSAPPAPENVAATPLPPSDPAGEAADMAAAAEAVAGAANDNAAPVIAIDDGVLDQMLETGGAVIVDMQFALQAYAIKRGLKKIAGPVPLDSPLRTGAAKAWAQQLKVWFPSASALPPWAIALVLPVCALPLQLATATDPPKEGEQPSKTEDVTGVSPVAVAQ